MKKIMLLTLVSLLAQAGIAQVSFTTQNIATSGSDRAIVDMNGDHLDDIVSVTATNIQIFHQQPDGSFVETNITTTPADYNPSWALPRRIMIEMDIPTFSTVVEVE